MALATPVAAVALMLGLAACAQEQSDDGRAAATRLVVEVMPEGSAGPSERRVVTDVPAEIRPEDFAPVPRNVACAEIYGGPATATVTGTLDGRRIEASFNRINACEMARWDRVQALLGPAPR